MAAGVFATAVQSGAADPRRSQVPADLEFGALWSTLLGDRASTSDPRLAGIVLSAWASVLGYLVTEIFGSLSRLVKDTDRLYVAHVRNGMLAMGYDPDLVEATSRGGVEPFVALLAPDLEWRGVERGHL